MFKVDDKNYISVDEEFIEFCLNGERISFAISNQRFLTCLSELIKLAEDEKQVNILTMQDLEKLNSSLQEVISAEKLAIKNSKKSLFVTGMLVGKKT